MNGVADSNAASAADKLLRSIRVGQRDGIDDRAEENEELINLAREVEPLEGGAAIAKRTGPVFDGFSPFKIFTTIGRTVPGG